ncbi:tetratricopeptide repeat protein [Gilvimarinus agarilyticus]|uniref:tetratricopeptide repeat protein n=1 Tax=unclassified Gilvimarinus TaxID=2642066 RepID=UPI001C0A64E1|nr:MULTISPECIES: tetratricopeptide repeat protein [unclassified Gilvimarinus]MBU2886231.1 tetratricopeptide repeat protein [Gilvimarinus agarilyticus]MDO6570919.1 tetratricopeptide repeat protein [Gilvimarinus sp. 2_MG-2023]MDO6747794.1 tetratricopeptide repeat protein [Gilvimarinus sp. 1_MG-2023]
MNCVKTRTSLFGRGLTAVAISLLLVGCATAPEPESTSAEQSPEAFNAVLPAGPVTQNPYSQGAPPSVSRTISRDFQAALTAMDKQRWSQARPILQAIVAQAPELTAPWLNLGIVWTQLDEPGQAQAAFERALAANPLNVDAYNHLAALQRRQGEFAAAEQLYQDALAVWPHSVASHKNLGILYDLYTGRWPRALLHYQAAQYIIEQTQGQPDPTLAGWIIDLQRRIAAGGPL